MKRHYLLSGHAIKDKFQSLLREHHLQNQSEFAVLILYFQFFFISITAQDHLGRDTAPNKRMFQDQSKFHLIAVVSIELFICGCHSHENSCLLIAVVVKYLLLICLIQPLNFKPEVFLI